MGLGSGSAILPVRRPVLCASLRFLSDKSCTKYMCRCCGTTAARRPFPSSRWWRCSPSGSASLSRSPSSAPISASGGRPLSSPSAPIRFRDRSLTRASTHRYQQIITIDIRRVPVLSRKVQGLFSVPVVVCKQGCGSGSVLESEAGSESALQSDFRSFRGTKHSSGGPWTLTIEDWRLKMEPWRVYRPVFEDSHHFDEEQVKVNSWIRLRIYIKAVLRIQI
jgi:hypothetical protein